MSLEDGTVQGFDVRAAKSDATSELKPSFTLHAHDKAVCTVSYNPSAPNVRNYHPDRKSTRLNSSHSLSSRMPSSA